MSRVSTVVTGNRWRKQAPSVADGEPAALSIDCDGVICDSNAAAIALFGLSHDELLYQHVSLLLPELADVEWVQKGRPNHHLNYLSHIGHRFDAVTSAGESFPVRIFINDLGNAGNCTLRLVIREVGDAPDGVAAVTTVRPIRADGND